MLNLTPSPIMLLTAEGPSDIVLHPAGRTAAEHVADGYIVSSRRIRIGSSAMDAATLRPPVADQILELNRFLEHEIERDRADNRGDGMVLVDRNVLRHVDPRLAAHVAEPHPDPLQEGGPEPLKVRLLIRPATGPTTEKDSGRDDGYTLYLDRARMRRKDPVTEKIRPRRDVGATAVDGPRGSPVRGQRTPLGTR